MSYIRRPYSMPGEEYVPPPPTQQPKTTYMFRPPSFKGVFWLVVLAVIMLFIGLSGIGQCVDDISLGHLSNGQLVGAMTKAILGPVGFLLFLFLASRLARNAWECKKVEAQFYYGKR